jgi:hypothetical protein
MNLCGSKEINMSTAIGEILDVSVVQYYVVNVGDMPDGFEDYLAGWNNVNDGYVGILLDDSLLEDCPSMANLIIEFHRIGVDYILVHVDY